MGPALALAALSLWGERTRAEYVAARMTELDELGNQTGRPVALIVPLSGGDGALEALRQLGAQDYTNYELVIAARDANCLPSGALPPRMKVALGGKGGRIALLESGVRAARRSTEVFAFGAPEGSVSRFWLRALVAPLKGEVAGASTGFRCYAPDPPAFWPLVRSVWNSVLAGRLGPGGNPFAWSGAMAITKEAFQQARVAEYWDGAERDDLALARALRESRRPIAFAPGAMVVYSEGVTARGFFQQARREMALARVALPWVWWTGLVSHVIYCGAMVAILIAVARGSRGAEWALVALFGLGMLKGANRATLAKAQLPELREWFDRYSWTHTFWVPLVTWVWVVVLMWSAFGRHDSKRV